MARAKKDGVYLNVRIETPIYKSFRKYARRQGSLRPLWLNERLLRILRNTIGSRRYCGNIRMMYDHLILR